MLITFEKKNTSLGVQFQKFDFINFQDCKQYFQNYLTAINLLFCVNFGNKPLVSKVQKKQVLNIFIKKQYYYLLLKFSKTLFQNLHLQKFCKHYLDLSMTSNKNLIWWHSF